MKVKYREKSKSDDNIFTMRGNYINGLRNGQWIEYHWKLCNSIGEYLNGERVGIWSVDVDFLITVDFEYPLNEENNDLVESCTVQPWLKYNDWTLEKFNLDHLDGWIIVGEILINGRYEYFHRHEKTKEDVVKFLKNNTDYRCFIHNRNI